MWGRGGVGRGLPSGRCGLGCCSSCEVVLGLGVGLQCKQGLITCLVVHMCCVQCVYTGLLLLMLYVLLTHLRVLL